MHLASAAPGPPALLLHTLYMLLDPSPPPPCLPSQLAGPLSEQNIKDRYYGVNDPVANKMMDRVSGMAKLTPPEDTTICTLFVGGVMGASRPLLDAPTGNAGMLPQLCTLVCHFSKHLRAPCNPFRPSSSSLSSSPTLSIPPPPLCLPICAAADDISEDDLRDQFYPFGELRSVKKVATRKCAFVTYATREAAERAAEEKSGT